MVSDVAFAIVVMNVLWMLQLHYIIYKLGCSLEEMRHYIQSPEIKNCLTRVGNDRKFDGLAMMLLISICSVFVFPTLSMYVSIK
jgi:hypothetical protein